MTSLRNSSGLGVLSRRFPCCRSAVAALRLGSTSQLRWLKSPSAEGGECAHRNHRSAAGPVGERRHRAACLLPGGGGIGGGTSTTAGNLVFQKINDGTFRAISADKGEVLYEIKVGRTGMAPPITYEVDGKQYVAFGGGLGRQATIVGANNAKIDAPPIMFVYALDGKAELPAPAPPPAQGPPPAPPAPEQRQP